MIYRFNSSIIRLNRTFSLVNLLQHILITSFSHLKRNHQKLQTCLIDKSFTTLNSHEDDESLFLFRVKWFDTIFRRLPYQFNVTTLEAIGKVEIVFHWIETFSNLIHFFRRTQHLVSFRLYLYKWLPSFLWSRGDLSHNWRKVSMLRSNAR